MTSLSGHALAVARTGTAVVTDGDAVSTFASKVGARTLKIGIVGLGYTGLPLALGFADAAGDLATMIEGRKLQQVERAAGRASFLIVRPVNHARQPDVDHGARAHRARFFCHV